jgi:dihydroxyacetone kinase-like protein
MSPTEWSMDLGDVERVVHVASTGIVANEKYFGDLDSVVGDGDFGYSLARGFEVVVADWDTLDRADIGAFLKRIALVLSGKVGGTSGPIWSTGFLRAATTVKSEPTIDAALLVAMLRASIEGIKKRGNSDLGDKTLLDALAPAVDELELALAEEDDGAVVARRTATAARRAADATSTMLAKRGRASYTGERSIGSPDAGAVAVAVLLEAVADSWPAADTTSLQQEASE